METLRALYRRTLFEIHVHVVVFRALELSVRILEKSRFCQNVLLLFLFCFRIKNRRLKAYFANITIPDVNLSILWIARRNTEERLLKTVKRMNYLPLTLADFQAILSRLASFNSGSL